MATGACELNNLLTTFADNTTQNISPADMRLLINCIYGNFLEISEVVDNLDTYDPLKGLSANSGAVLNDKVENNEARITSNEINKADANDVYTKGESDTRYYTQTQIDSGFYTKTEVYTKQEVDNALFAIQQNLQALSERIDNIVTKNNLIE